MSKTHKSKSPKNGLMKYKWLALVAWTLFMIVLLLISLNMVNGAAQNLAIKEARTHFQKDKVFRYWSATHGGFYVPISDRTPPSPYLAHIPERDIQTPSGKKLTLMNPAWALRQMNEDYAEIFGVVGHITSLQPLRAENAPDDWERQALESFENGETEVLEFIESGDNPSLRLMQPLITAEGCLKCHGHQGYEVGDVRGGVSVSVPLDVYFTQKQHVSKTQKYSFTMLWLIGIGAIVYGFYIAKNNKQERELQKSEEKFREVLENIQLIGLMLDKDANIIFANDYLLKLTGWERKEVMGKNWFDYFIDKSINKEIKQVFKKTITENKVTSTHTNEILAKSGDKLLIKWSNNTHYDSDNLPYAVTSIGEDITKQHKSEEELAKHRDNLEILVKKRTAELEEKNADLQHSFDVMVDREIRMKELTDEIETIKSQKTE